MYIYIYLLVFEFVWPIQSTSKSQPFCILSLHSSGRMHHVFFRNVWYPMTLPVSRHLLHLRNHFYIASPIRNHI